MIAKGPDGLDHYLYLTPNEPISTLFGGASNLPPVPLPPNTVPEPGPIYLIGLVGACSVVKRLRAHPSRVPRP